MVDTHFERADTQSAFAVAQRASEKEAWDPAGGAYRIKAAAPLPHRLLEVGAVGQVDSYEARFFVPVAGSKRSSFVIQDIQDRGMRCLIDALQPVVYRARQVRIGGIPQQKNDVAFKGQQVR